MRVELDGLRLETVAYAEGDEISFTFFTVDDDLGQALNETLCSEERVLELRRGGEEVPVRVREHEVTPPYSRRFSGAIHRHSVRLEQIGAAVVPFPVAASRAYHAAMVAAR